MAASTTTYPYLTTLIEALESGLTLDYPVQAYASLESLSIQGTPLVALVIEDTPILDAIANGRKVREWRCLQNLTIVVVLRQAGDQAVTAELITTLGEWQAAILSILGNNVISSGGPVKLQAIAKPEAIAGGAIAGRIQLGIQFVFTLE